jgi:type I restriction enzyme S subunit
MKKGWGMKPLMSICENLDSQRIPITKSKRLAGEIPYYGASGVVDYVKDYLFDDDFLLVSEDGANLLARTYPIAFSVSGKTWVNNHAHVLKFNNSTTQDFAEYYLNSIKLDEYISGMAQPKLNQKKLNSIPIPIPPLSEQEEIVEVLDKAFAAIDQAKANIEQNIANAKELFQSKLNQIFSQKGEGWVSGTINDLVKNGVLSKPSDGNHGEIHPKKADFVEKGIPFVMASDLQNGEVNQTDCNFITKIQADKLRKGFAEDGDVLLSHKGTIGRVAKLQTELDYIMLTPQVTYYRITDDEILTGDYLYFYLRSPLFQKPLQHIAGAGSTRAYIGITKQRELEIAYPTCIKEQSDIAHSLRELERKTDAANQLYVPKLASLDELKKSILQKAFAGELT